MSRRLSLSVLDDVSDACRCYQLLEFRFVVKDALRLVNGWWLSTNPLLYHTQQAYTQQERSGTVGR